MTYTNILQAINNICTASVKFVKSVTDGDVYDNWNNAQKLKYGAINTTLSSVEVVGNVTNYKVMLYYGDLLQEDESNENIIVDNGVAILSSVLNSLANSYDVEIVGDIIFNKFSQKFADLLAGVYAEVIIEARNEIGECNVYGDDFALPVKPIQPIPSSYYTKVEVDALLSAKADRTHTHQISQVNGLSNALSSKANATHTHTTEQIDGLDSVLSGKADTNHTHEMSQVDGLSGALSGKASAVHTHTKSEITDFPNLSAVATSGNYNDLSNTPTIPSVPTNVSAFNNDAGYITEHQSLSGYATEQWVEDKGYLTEHQSLDSKQDVLVSGTNIKTINGESILGSGDVEIQGGGNEVHYVACSGSTAAVTSSPYYGTRLVGTCDGVSELYSGLVVAIKLDVAGNGTYGTLLNINNLGEHPIVYNVNSAIGTRYGVNSIVVAVYDADGTASAYINSGSASTISGTWKVCDYDTTNVYQLRNNSAIYNIASGTKMYRYRLAMTNSDGKLVPFNNSTSTSTTGDKSSALATDEFNPFEPIYYYNSSVAITATTTNLTSQLYRQVTFDIRYSWYKSGFALTNASDVYIKATPTDGGMATLDTTTPIVCALPTSEDGSIYIYLGHSYSTTSMELSVTHPIFYYKDGAIRLYSNQVTSGGGGSAATPLVEMTETTATLQPNTFYRWGEVSSLDLSLGAEHSGVLNRYMFEFRSGENAPTLSLPSDVVWSEREVINLKEKAKYQISIIDNIAKVDRNWWDVSYITDGLIFRVDGLNKGGVSGTWKDLVGGITFTNNGATEENNCFDFGGSAYMISNTQLATTDYDSVTIEVCYMARSFSMAGIMSTNTTNGFLYLYKTTDYLCISHPRSSMWSKSHLVNTFYSESANVDNVLSNGVAMTQYSSDYWNQSSNKPTIGRIGTLNYYFNGKIYAIRVYNRKLTTEEMLYNQALDAQRFGL